MFSFENAEFRYEPYPIGAIAPIRGRVTLQVAAQTATTTVLSTFMNNIGALALMLPVAMRNAHSGRYAPARALMPLASASLLGGMVTLIGTPPNLIVSAYREDNLGVPFQMFDFLPVGLAYHMVLSVAAAGVWWLAAARAWPEDPTAAAGLDEEPRS